jgi:hypothetical protein
MIEENSIVHDEIVTTEITTTTTTTIQPTSEHKALDITIAAGALNSLGSQDSYALFPTAVIEVYAQTAEYKYTPDIIVKVNLTALPEEEISLSDVASFKSLKFEAGIRQGIPGVYTKLYAGFGIETRLPGETKPRVNAAKYFTAGVYFTTNDNSSYIYVGGGPDQRLDFEGRYLVTAHIAGMLKLYNYKDAKLSLKGDAILSGQSSLVRIGIVVGI